MLTSPHSAYVCTPRTFSPLMHPQLVVPSPVPLPTCASGLIGPSHPVLHTSPAWPYNRPTLFTHLFLPNKGSSVPMPLCFHSGLPSMPLAHTSTPAPASLTGEGGTGQALLMSPSGSDRFANSLCLRLAIPIRQCLPIFWSTTSVTVSAPRDMLSDEGS